jgi:hypothetical protein
MATSYEELTVKGEGLTLSLLIWRRFKRPMIGLVERILAEQGHLSKQFLDVGDVVLIPIDTPDAAPRKIATVSLWD